VTVCVFAQTAHELPGIEKNSYMIEHPFFDHIFSNLIILKRIILYGMDIFKLQKYTLIFLENGHGHIYHGDEFVKSVYMVQSNEIVKWVTPIQLSNGMIITAGSDWVLRFWTPEFESIEWFDNASPIISIAAHGNVFAYIDMAEGYFNFYYIGEKTTKSWLNPKKLNKDILEYKIWDDKLSECKNVDGLYPKVHINDQFMVFMGVDVEVYDHYRQCLATIKSSCEDRDIVVRQDYIIINGLTYTKYGTILTRIDIDLC
jgi:hypothetical protein